ncbi:MAG: hypothetical protein DRI89_03025 [Bacteroidetes bacterium]|nr:MAG: hypothetical protein DRI89_03025 [Bacteroidota bacterium]
MVFFALGQVLNVAKSFVEKMLKGKYLKKCNTKTVPFRKVYKFVLLELTEKSNVISTPST